MTWREISPVQATDMIVNADRVTAVDFDELTIRILGHTYQMRWPDEGEPAIAEWRE